jgi:acetyl esterase/lipase
MTVLTSKIALPRRAIASLTLMAAGVLVGGSLVLARQGAPSGIPAKLASYQNIPLWEPGKVPLGSGDGPLDAPFLTVFQPPAAERTGASVIIAPGGANIMLMYGAEGFEVGERYNEWGATAFVLTYRLSPKYNNQARILDGQRAVRLVRAHAALWGLDPKRVGYIGFSAGSNMGRSIVASPSAGDATAADPVDRVSARPDYLALVYGAGNPTPGESLKDFPPTFLLSAAADTGPSLGNAQLFMDLTRAGAVAEMHIYQRGRHGFGGGFGSPEFSLWMDQLKHFLDMNRLLTSPEEEAARASRGGSRPNVRTSSRQEGR